SRPPSPSPSTFRLPPPEEGGEISITAGGEFCITADRLPGLAHDGPGCNLQAVTLRAHFWTPVMAERAEALGHAPAHGRLRMAPRPCPFVPPSRPPRPR